MKTLATLFLSLLIALPVQANTFSKNSPAEIFMIVWRGCEEACQGFKQYLQDHELPVKITVRDVARDKKKLPIYLKEAQKLKPDLVVTWGTSVSKAIIGPIDNNNSNKYLSKDIPVLFMVVADPIGAGIIHSYDQSGRDHVTGIRNRVPEEVQIRAIKDYMDAKKIGVVYSNAELNSVLNTKKLQQLAGSMDFQLIEKEYALDDSGKPLPNQIPRIMQELATENVDIIYVGSSSYNRQNRDTFINAANDRNIPVASAYEVMVTKSNGLIAVANRYYNVGRLAANQAQKVLFLQQSPGDLNIPSLSRYSVFINMKVARKLQNFPPIQLLRFAELVNP